MLHTFLQNAVNDLQALIAINKLDMQDIKEANHEAIFSRLESKNNHIDSFKNNKTLADTEMQKMMKNYPNKSIEELLDAKAMEIIDEMRSSLEELRNLNKSYAKSVIAVSEFYASLVNAIMPSQKISYGNNAYAVDCANIDFVRYEA